MSTVKSVYAHLDSLIDGIDALKRKGVTDFVVTAPLPRHEILEQVYEGRPSPVRWFTMTGAILGGMCGFALCSITHLNWPMIIPAGKPLVSIPPFIIIMFESTILWGCLGTLLGLLYHCRLPAVKMQEELTDKRFSDDKFGLVVNGLSGDAVAEISTMLNDSGAIEVSSKEAAHA